MKTFFFMSIDEFCFLGARTNFGIPAQVHSDTPKEFSTVSQFDTNCEDTKKSLNGGYDDFNFKDRYLEMIEDDIIYVCILRYLNSKITSSR